MTYKRYLAKVALESKLKTGTAFQIGSAARKLVKVSGSARADEVLDEVFAVHLAASVASPLVFLRDTKDQALTLNKFKESLVFENLEKLCWDGRTQYPEFGAFEEKLRGWLMGLGWSGTERDAFAPLEKYLYVNDYDKSCFDQGRRQKDDFYSRYERMSKAMIQAIEYRPDMNDPQIMAAVVAREAVKELVDAS